MGDEQLRLDGNAAAGLFRDIFVSDLTSAQGACAACGAIAPMGSQHLYMTSLSPGAVLRCRSCQEVLMVLVHADGRYRLGLRGLVWLEVADSDTVPARG